MSWVEKALERRRTEKLIEEVMNTPEFKERQRQMDEATLSNAIGRIAFITCEFLETRHNYKAAGLKKFLSFLVGCLEYVGDNDTFFVDIENYFKEEYGLDVLAELGMGLKDVQP